MIMDEINYSIFGNQAEREKAERNLGMEDKRCYNCTYGDLSMKEYPCSECIKQYDAELKNLNFWEAEKVNKNYIKQFIEDNGLKIEIEFSIETYNENDDIFRFDREYNLRDHNGEFRNELLFELLSGTVKVMPLPFSPTNLPKEGEKVWYVAATGIESLSFNLNFAMLYALVASGNAFRTKEEAELAAPRVRKEQGMINE